MTSRGKESRPVGDKHWEREKHFLSWDTRENAVHALTWQKNRRQRRCPAPHGATAPSAGGRGNALHPAPHPAHLPRQNGCSQVRAQGETVGFWKVFNLRPRISFFFWGLGKFEVVPFSLSVTVLLTLALRRLQQSAQELWGGGNGKRSSFFLITSQEFKRGGSRKGVLTSDCLDCSHNSTTY